MFLVIGAPSDHRIRAGTCLPEFTEMMGVVLAGCVMRELFQWDKTLQAHTEVPSKSIHVDRIV